MVLGLLDVYQGAAVLRFVNQIPVSPDDSAVAILLKVKSLQNKATLMA